MSEHHDLWRSVKTRIRDDGIAYSTRLLQVAIRCQDVWLVNEITRTKPELITLGMLNDMSEKHRIAAYPEPISYEMLVILARRIVPSSFDKSDLNVHYAMLNIYNRLHTIRGRVIIRIMLSRGIYVYDSLRALIGVCRAMQHGTAFEYDGDNFRALVEVGETIRFKIAVLFYFKQKLPVELSRLIITACCL
jgi:hypothetical protein